MYNEAVARAVLAERARERDAVIHSNRMLAHTRRRRSADGFLARLLGRRQWSGPRAGTPTPAPVVAIEMADRRSTAPPELRASWK